MQFRLQGCQYNRGATICTILRTLVRDRYRTVVLIAGGEVSPLFCLAGAFIAFDVAKLSCRVCNEAQCPLNII